MNKQEIENYNRLCAKFLGYSNPIIDIDFYFVEHSNYNIESSIPKLLELNFEKRFHSDWNWIMEVINSIKNTKNPKEHSDTTFSTLRREIQTHLGRANKEAVVKAINQFLIWYNGTKL